MRRVLSTVPTLLALAATAAAQTDPFCDIQELGSLDIDGGYAIDVEGSLAYIRGVEVLHIVDVSDPASPRLLSTTPANGLADLDVVGTRVYLARFFGGSLDIYDTSDPTSPRLLSSLPMAGPEFVEVVNDIVYVGSYQTSILHLIDANDPTAPFERSSIRLGQGIRRLFVHWPTAYVSNLDNLITIDVSDPDEPRELDRIGTETSVEAVVGTLAFTREGHGADSMYRLIHVGRPDALRLYRVGDFDAATYRQPWQVVGDTLFTLGQGGTGGRGIAVHDFTDPVHPRTMTEIPTSGSAVAFEVADQRLYCISRGSFQIFDIGGCPPYPFCPADLNADGIANFFDLQEFLNLYLAGKLQADFDRDGVLTPADLVAFQAALAAGCP